MLFGEMLEAYGIAFLASDLYGILGLGYETISFEGIPVFIDAATNLQTKDFSFYLHKNPDQSKMTLPGYDPSIMDPTKL